MTDAIDHYRTHEETYDTISKSLENVRTQFEQSSRFEQKIMLYDSTVFAVASVQNSVEMLERAFRSYSRADSWNSVKEAFRHLNYGNNKYRYIRENYDTIFSSEGTTICHLLEKGDVWKAVEQIVDTFKGVSWIKAAFVPAMLGFTDVMCIDTNVAQMHPDDSVQARGYKSGDEYRKVVQKIKDRFPELDEQVDTFMLQWIIFDVNRENGVEKHSEWFEHMLPGTPFARQTALSNF